MTYSYISGWRKNGEVLSFKKKLFNHTVTHYSTNLSHALIHKLSLLSLHVQLLENTNFSKAAFSKKRQKVKVRESNDILVNDVWFLNRDAVPFCKRDGLQTKHKHAIAGLIHYTNGRTFNILLHSPLTRYNVLLYDKAGTDFLCHNFLCSFISVIIWSVWGLIVNYAINHPENGTKK